MQAAADMPRPVGARCRDAAVCLALALLVASWLCAPALGQPAHGQPAPGQPEPGQPLPGQPGPGLLGPEQPAPEHPGPVLPAPGRPAPGRPAPGQPVPGQPAPGQPGPELPGPAPHVCGLQFNTSIDNFSARPASMACMRARRSALRLLPACSRLRCPALEQHGASVRQCWAWARGSVYHTGPGQLDTAHVPVRQGLGRYAARVLRDVPLGLLRAGALRPHPPLRHARALGARAHTEGPGAAQWGGESCVWQWCQRQDGCATANGSVPQRTCMTSRQESFPLTWQPGTVISGAPHGPPAGAGAAAHRLPARPARACQESCGERASRPQVRARPCEAK
jgi:hypothetical protein